MVFNCNPSAVLNGTYPQTPYTILSFKDQNPESMSGNTTVPFCTSQSQNYVIPKVQFNTPQGITGTYRADGYEWTIPSGWVYADGTVSNGSARNFFDGNANQISVVPNQCSGGTIRVRAFGTNDDNQIVTRSNYRDLVVTRTVSSINITANRQINPMRCDDIENIIFTAQNANCGTSYNWSLPNGWVTVSQSGNQITVRPNGTGGGTISVLANLVCSGVTTSGELSIPFDNSVDTPVFTLAPSTICNNTTQNFTVSVPQGNPRTFTWTVGSGLRLPNGAQTQTFNFEANQTGHTVAIIGQNSGNGFVNVSVTAANRCGGVSTASRQVFLGIPQQPSSLAGPSNPFAGNVYQLQAGQAPGATSYQWSIIDGVSNPPLVPLGWSFWSGQPTGLTALVQFGSEDGFVVVQGCNECGCGPSRSVFYPMSSPGGGGGGPGGGGPGGTPIPRPSGAPSTISPNPVVQGADLVIDLPQQGYEYISLFDNLGRVLWQTKSESDKVYLSTKGYSAGIYFIHFSNASGERITKKLWIE